MPFNWVDICIVIVVFLFLIDGWKVGLISLLANFLSFLGSLWISVRFHEQVGNFVATRFGIPLIWTQVVGYVVVAIISEAILAEVIYLGLKKLPYKLHISTPNRWLGSIVAVANALVLISFVLLLLSSLPLRGSLRQDIAKSPLSGILIHLAEQYGGSVKSSVDDVAQKALQFLTIHPNSDETIELVEVPANVSQSIDATSEQEMFELLNTERTKVGAGALRLESEMTAVARAHSQDMFTRRYFSHFDPEGRDVADRMKSKNIRFFMVGENLAYAPDMRSAHQGLMNSEGHRRNILEPQFTRVGVGVIDAGIYGKMFTQVFAD